MCIHFYITETKKKFLIEQFRGHNLEGTGAETAQSVVVQACSWSYYNLTDHEGTRNRIMFKP